MAYTLTTATTQVRYLINEATANFWSDAEIQSWIKQGCYDLSSKLYCCSADDDITLATDKSVYKTADEAWIANCIKVLYAWYVPASNQRRALGRLEISRLGHTQHQQTSGEPRYYFDWIGEEGLDGVIEIWPRPSASENGDTVTIYYAQRTDDITKIPDQYQHLVFLFATAKAKIKDRHHNEASLLMAEYTNAINFERKDKLNQGTDAGNDFKDI